MVLLDGLEDPDADPSGSPLASRGPVSRPDELEITIQAGRVPAQYWKDLWNYRELLYVLAWRDILVRYKQAFFGVAWAVIRPLATMAIFVFVFGKIARLPT